MGASDRTAAGTLRMRAPAKVNLWLEVLGRRPDGYHEIRTIMQAVSLYDELTFRARDDGQVVLRAEGEGLPAAEQNLVVRAARLLQKATGSRFGADITLQKRIPIGAGLGGGSSDCAAALQGLNRLWELGLGRERLAEMAAQLGSDVAFFLWGGAALCEGRGERVTPLAVGGTFHYVLVMPRISLSTAQVYGNAEACLTSPGHDCNIVRVRQSLAKGDVRTLGASLYNVLEGPAIRLHPEVRHIAERLRLTCSAGDSLGVSLSGSGSSFFAVFPGSEQARESSAKLEKELDVPARAVEGLPQT